MMAVPIDATGQFNAGVPQVLFPTSAGRHQPEVRCDKGWKAIPGQRDAPAVPVDAADRRRQLDGHDPEIGGLSQPALEYPRGCSAFPTEDVWQFHAAGS
jgi:hypothetical protein